MNNRTLRINGARENNLKDLSIEIPHDSFVALTGVSGSGKSSLAFDTVYAEGQRRYIETFSPYTRQFFDKVKKPEVDTVEHVRPAIAIQQRTRVTNSRSTVGSMTGVNDYLKILWSNVATPFCTECGVAFERWESNKLTRHISELHRLRGFPTLLICSPIRVQEGKKALEGEKERLELLGYSRFYDARKTAIVSGDEIDQSTLLPDGRLLVVLDRLRAGTCDEKRLSESVQQAFTLSSGACIVVDLDAAGGLRHRRYMVVLNNVQQENRRALPGLDEYRSSYSCSAMNIVIERQRPALFSFNHPVGACSECNGFGRILRVDPALCIPNPGLSIEEKAIQCWSTERAKREFKKLIAFCKTRKISITIPWRELSAEAKELIFTHRSREFRGIFPWFKSLERKIYKMHVRVFLSRYRNQFECPSCHGTRLRSDALAYRILGLTLPDIWSMPVVDLHEWLSRLKGELKVKHGYTRDIAEIFNNMLSRLEYLLALGLPYLTLERQARTLSGGETQRVNLAAALGSELVTTHFVLDEPSVGLHARDTERLVQAVKRLKERGNSLLVVEHDPDFIANADHVIELGPEAGERGGEVTFHGEQELWVGIPIPPSASMPERKSGAFAAGKLLKITNASARNLKNLSLELPLERFVCLTGVSGSGKSTLINEVIKKAYDGYCNSEGATSEQNLVSGFEHVDQLLLVDQAPLAKSPRANIGTYTGIWENLRSLFAKTEDAKARGLSKSSFSFNVDGGRCPVCKGAGYIREDMQFLSDVYIPCELCLGKRFQSTVLEVRFRGYNVHEYMAMSADECAQHFAEEQSIVSPARTLCKLGLGHITLGHPLSELSGGEAQRLKLVPFVERAAKGKSLLIFDEPTIGLHVKDVERLRQLFFLLRDMGHSVLCIEHNLQLVASSDWIIDLGPEGGEGGGFLLKAGTPHEFISDNNAPSATAKFLQRFLESYKQDTLRTKTTRSRLLKKHEKPALLIRGAREHNLKNIDISVPLDAMVAITGVSGSGKSTIAKDIIYAEGQRRYLDCLSPYARQFIKELKRPEIESISNVKPTICVYQHTFQPSRLSTVGTMSEVYNYLRLLYSKAAVQFCPEHPTYEIAPASPKSIADSILEMKCSKVRVLAPVIKQKKGSHRAVFERAISSEISEVRVDGVFGRPSLYSDGLEKGKQHSIEFVVAKFSPENVERELLEESIVQALGLGAGVVVVQAAEFNHIFSIERTCPICSRGFYKPDPEDLSFSSRRGRCERCDGSGVDSRGKTCRECEGSRLNPLGRNLRLSGKNIFEAASLSAPELKEFLSTLTLNERRRRLSRTVLSELGSRLDILCSIGLDYLPLSQDCSTLASGELQRLRLATAIGSPLCGVMYIFDEPSAGLHPMDNARVISELRALKERGNSVLVIEHDEDTILASDYVIDAGPGGGSRGGEIVYAGPLAQFLSCAESQTARALKSRDEKGRLQSRSALTHKERLCISQGSKNNIRALSVDIPLRSLTTVIGASGAGKSSLVHGIISQTISSSEGKRAWQGELGRIESSLEISKVVFVDQKPIGANARSTPASYLGILDELRSVYSATVEAKARGWKAGFFSYNTGKGRCPACKGQGQVKLEMSFLPDAYVLCDVCAGQRFTAEAQTVRYLGHAINEVLCMTFEQARLVFANHRRIHEVLHHACELGLGYLTLGQSSSTLSGGESQRIKLVAELISRAGGHTLYLLDEPTTGLHKSDVARLVRFLRSLVDRGNTAIVIEHEVEFICGADFLLELGPGPAEKGGRLIFCGTPAELAEAETPWGGIIRERLRECDDQAVSIRYDSLQSP